MISFNGGSCNNSGIERFFINDAGNLIVVYNNGLFEDLGHVVGADGTNFYPNEVGFDIPDDSFEQDKSLGWTYLSLANNTSILYFKTSEENVSPSTWNSVEFGKGEKGDNGESFHIDSSGEIFPTTGLFNNYTFLKNSTGEVFYYDLSLASWAGPYKWRGDVGPRGIFKIDEQDVSFPDITNLDIGYTFYNTDTGMLYYVELNQLEEKVWSSGILFRGPQGPKGDTGLKGDTGEAGKEIYIIQSEIDNSYQNTLLQIGKCPAGYVVSNIEVTIETAYSGIVQEMAVRFGGTLQDESSGIIIADYSLFDIQIEEQFIVNGVNHTPSVDEEIICCVFDNSVHNSLYGMMKITCTLSPVQNSNPIIVFAMGVI